MFEFLRLYATGCYPNPIIHITRGATIFISGCYFEADKTGSIIYGESSIVSLHRSHISHIESTGPVVFRECLVNVGSSMFGPHPSCDAHRNSDIELYGSVASIAGNGYAFTSSCIPLCNILTPLLSQFLRRAHHSCLLSQDASTA